MRYFVEISFDGTDFFGWQVQPDKQTVQGELNGVLSQILQEDIHVVGCGRTDTGVHASQYFLHFETTTILPAEFIYKLNQMLPTSIVVHNLFKVNADLHSRFSAVQRSYTYHLHFQKNPFKERFSTYCYYKNLDIELMKQVAKELINYHDFKVLSKTAVEQNHSLCDIYNSQLLFYENDHRMEYHVTANRYLHNMIRRIIGLLLNVGRGKISLDQFRKAMNGQESLRLNTVAPPQGLFLSKVTYGGLK